MFVEGLESRMFLSGAPPIAGATDVAAAATGPAAIHVGMTPDKPATGSPSLSGAISGLAASGVTNTKTPASIKLTLTNAGSAAAAGRVTITLFASADQTLDSGDAKINAVTRVLSIRPGKSQALLVPLKQFPDLVTGPYYVLAQVTGPAAASLGAPVASAGTIFMTPPYIDLTGAFESVPASVTLRHSEALTFLVVNNGNTPAKGRLQVVLQASPSANGASATVLKTVTRQVNLKPQGQARFALTGRVELAAGTYYIAAEIDPNNVFNDLNPDNNLVITPSPITFQ